jgi:hypothetical protein
LRLFSAEHHLLLTPNVAVTSAEWKARFRRYHRVGSSGAGKDLPVQACWTDGGVDQSRQQWSFAHLFRPQMQYHFCSAKPGPVHVFGTLPARAAVQSTGTVGGAGSARRQARLLRHRAVIIQCCQPLAGTQSLRPSLSLSLSSSSSSLFAFTQLTLAPPLLCSPSLN